METPKEDAVNPEVSNALILDPHFQLLDAVEDNLQVEAEQVYGDFAQLWPYAGKPLMRVKDLESSAAKEIALREIDYEQQSCRRMNMLASGITLFKTHGVRNIKASRTSYRPVEDDHICKISDDCAEMLAGSRWSQLSTQEQDFWASETKQLMAAASESLDDSTYAKFIDRDFAASCSGQILINHPICFRIPTPDVNAPSKIVNQPCSDCSHPVLVPQQPPVVSRGGLYTLSSKITDLIDTAESLCDDPLAVLNALADVLTADGRALFGRHGLLPAEEKVGPEKASAYVADVWNSLGPEAKSYWRAQTSWIQNGLRKNIKGWLDHVKNQQCSPRNIQYFCRIRQSLEAYELRNEDGQGAHRLSDSSDAAVCEVNDNLRTGFVAPNLLRENDDVPSTSSESSDRFLKTEAILTTNTRHSNNFAMKFLCGSLSVRGRTPSADEIVWKSLQGIENRICENTNSQLTGRFRGTRLNYDPLAEDVTRETKVEDG
ncbi:Hypothetical predicted protein [Lecanosticta acicola]|uniref:Uncharacterized protein n=1 Tax=Lecanosticta acicola TaxID=111012 RepID=A0AAI8YT62_9PEZI|nr:Hypothetical predicted protein [Lecanosticta acicola]